MTKLFRSYLVIISTICIYQFLEIMVQFFSDERDAIQKKTFTKWVNKHLKKVRRYFLLTNFYKYFLNQI